jgi:hypothetical protein
MNRFIGSLVAAALALGGSAAFAQAPKSGLRISTEKPGHCKPTGSRPRPA